MNKTLTALLLLVLAASAGAQDLSLYQKKWLVQGSDSLPYRLLLPAQYDEDKEYPVILFLHGAGERGSDNEKQLVHGAKLFVREDVRRDYPAIVIFPQCPENSYWSNVQIERDSAGKRSFNFQAGGAPTTPMVLVQALLRQVLKEYPVEKDQVYVMGLSMGGMGTFEIVSRNPKLFAAAVPICGGANPAVAKKLRKVEWWVFHGAKDDVVPPEHSQQMVDALKKRRADVRFTLYPEANHNSWDSAFAEKDLLPWLFAQDK